MLQAGRVNIRKAMTPKEQADERALQNELAALNSQITREGQRPQPDTARLADLNDRRDKGRLALEAFQSRLYAAHPELTIRRGEAKPVTLEEARLLVPNAQSALLEFVVGKENTYLFVLTAGGASGSGAPVLTTYSIPIKLQDLARRVAEFRERVSDPHRSVRESARALYDLLLKPAQAALAGKTTLVIVPDGPLWELPFQALQSKENHFLLEDRTISYAPSLTALREMRRVRDARNRGAVLTRRPPLHLAARAVSLVPGAQVERRPGGEGNQPAGSFGPAPTLLALGNPALGQETRTRARFTRRGARLAPLPEAEREVQALGRLYGTARSRVYTGPRATEARAKAEAGRAPILHFATHGLLNGASPMYSHVLLAQGRGAANPGAANEDGLLEAWEILDLDLKADLVVLSACDTARGRFGAGEGVIGLSWALFVAGCPAAVVSQWEVDSASTTQLMVGFHRRLRARSAGRGGSASTAGALRQAALSVMRTPQYRHPFYWAGFVLVGDGR